MDARIVLATYTYLTIHIILQIGKMKIRQGMQNSVRVYTASHQ